MPGQQGLPDDALSCGTSLLSGDRVSRIPVLGESLADRKNSINFLRLVFAGVVLVEHAQSLGGFGNDIIWKTTSPGFWAVYGFFGISGYLITASAARNSVGRFLWSRIVRVFPGFLVCLVLTSFLFGLVGWYHGQPRCGFSCYLHVRNGPLAYILSNSWLRVNQQSISGTLRGVPFNRAWNGSLWSVYYEFLCYLVLVALVLARLLRRGFVLLLTIGLWLAEVLVAFSPHLNEQFSALKYIDGYKVLEVFPVFLVGVTLYLYREKVPDRGALALGSLGLFATNWLLPLHGKVPAFQLTSGDVLAPTLVYPVLWLGIHLPFHKIGARNDYSYGVYIYAYPVTQLLALWGAYHLGFVVYISLIIVMMAPFAVGSWWLIERRALRLKNFTPRYRGRSVRHRAQAIPEGPS